MKSSPQPGESLPPEIQELLARIPFFRQAANLCIAPLQGVVSLNNTNYRVTTAEGEYLLRYASEDARYLGVRREEEREAAHAAARCGIGPEILYSEAEGHLVTPWIQGRHWQPEEFHREEN